MSLFKVLQNKLPENVSEKTFINILILKIIKKYKIFI